MSNTFLKHVGVANAKKIIIVLHSMEEAGQEHMALVLFADSIPAAYKETLFQCLNSAEGQAAKNLASIIETKILPDGRNLGRVLHEEGHFKKLPTNQVFCQPNDANKIRLSDLNDLTSKIDAGGDALKRMEALENQKGMHRNKKGVRTMSDSSLDERLSKLNLSDPETVLAEMVSQSAKLRTAAEALIRDAEMMEGKAAQLQAATEPKAKKVAKKAMKP